MYRSGQTGQTVNLLANAYVGSNPTAPIAACRLSCGKPDTPWLAPTTTWREPIDRMEIKRISLKPSSIARLLGAVAFVLVLASVGFQVAAHLTGNFRMYGLVRLFNVDLEGNIPSLFSAGLLLFASLLLTVIAVREKRQAGHAMLHWAVLSFGFLFMAVDEACEFHEKLIEPVRHLLGDQNLGIFYHAWVIPGMALVLVLALFFFRFLLRLPAKSRSAFLVAAILYLGGAIGVELGAGLFVELHGRQSLTYSMIAAVEESLEMGGVIVFIWALLVFIDGPWGRKQKGA